MKTLPISALLVGIVAQVAVSQVAIAQVAVRPAATLDKTVRIGVLNDQSGANADMSGLGSVVAASMAIEDSGLRQKGWRIDLNAADHRNKSDIGSDIARGWADRNRIDMIADTPGFGVALAISRVAEERNIVHVNSGGAGATLTGSACTPNTVSFTYDTVMTERGTARTLTQMGGDTWFLLTEDHPFGTTMQNNVSGYVAGAGGAVIGSVRHPIHAPQFTQYLTQAVRSRAKVIGLANASGDAITQIQQAASFDLAARGQKLAAFILYVTDVHKMGLRTAQGVYLTESFYWDLNDSTRAWSRRFQLRVQNRAMPSMVQAGVYAGTLHYLRALEALGGNPHNGAQVVAKMKEIPAEDGLFGRSELRADGRRALPAYLFEVKKPAESRGPWDYYKLVAILSADEVMHPLRSSQCALARASASVAFATETPSDFAPPTRPSSPVIAPVPPLPPQLNIPFQQATPTAPPAAKPFTPPSAPGTSPLIVAAPPQAAIAAVQPAAAPPPVLAPPNPGAVPALPTLSQTASLRRVALVIGNGGYSSVTTLANPPRDAERMATLFRTAGFDAVTLEKNLGVSDMRKAVRTFAAAAATADIAVVYYAGHGIEVAGQNYLIPTDAVLGTDIDVQDETVALDRVIELLGPVRRLKLVILDACRDNPFRLQMRLTTAQRAVSRGLARPSAAPGNTLVLYAAGEKQTATDGDGENSPFTSALLRHLTTPGKDVRIAIGLVHDEVMQATGNQQEPYMYGALGGDNLSLAVARP